MAMTGNELALKGRTAICVNSQWLHVLESYSEVMAAFTNGMVAEIPTGRGGRFRKPTAMSGITFRPAFKELTAIHNGEDGEQNFAKQSVNPQYVSMVVDLASEMIGGASDGE